MLQANGEPDPEPGVWEDNPPTATNYTRAPGLDLAAMYQSYQTGSLSLSDQYKSITGSEKYRSLHSFSKDRPMGMHNRKEFDPTTTTYIRVLYGVMGFCAIGWPLLLLLTGSGTWAMGWTKLVPALAIAAGGWWEQRNQHISASIVDAALFFRAGLLMSMPFYLAQVVPVVLIASVGQFSLDLVGATGYSVLILGLLLHSGTAIWVRYTQFQLTRYLANKWPKALSLPHTMMAYGLAYLAGIYTTLNLLSVVVGIATTPGYASITLDGPAGSTSLSINTLVSSIHPDVTQWFPPEVDSPGFSSTSWSVLIPRDAIRVILRSTVFLWFMIGEVYSNTLASPPKLTVPGDAGEDPLVIEPQVPMVFVKRRSTWQYAALVLTVDTLIFLAQAMPALGLPGLYYGISLPVGLIFIVFVVRRYYALTVHHRQLMYSSFQNGIARRKIVGSPVPRK